MIDIIVSAILITFGLLSIYFSIENGISDPRLMLILVVGIVAVLAGSWILISTISIGVILQKIGALFMVGLGLFLVIGFPGVSEYQSPKIGKAGAFIGLIILIIGAYFLLF